MQTRSHPSDLTGIAMPRRFFSERHPRSPRTSGRTPSVPEPRPAAFPSVLHVEEGVADLDAAIIETARRLLSCREARISAEPASGHELGAALDHGATRSYLVVGERTGERRDFDLEDRALLENLATVASAARVQQRTLERLRRSEETRAIIVAALQQYLRTPLATVAATVQTMRRLRDQLDLATATEMLDVSDRQTQRALGLLDDVLVLERLTTDATANAPSDIAAAVAAVAASAPDGAVTVYSGGPALVRTEQGVIERIILNLVAAVREHAPTAAVRIGWAPAADDIILTVEAAETEPSEAGGGSPRRGQPPAQVDGVEIGLPLARRFAEMVGGRLETDVGARCASVRVLLPAAAPARSRQAGVVSADR